MTQHILLLHALPRRYYFRDVLTAYQEQGDLVGVVCDDGEAHNYRRNIAKGGKHFLFPDPNKSMSWERGGDEEARLKDLLCRCERASGLAVGRILLAGDRDLGRGFGVDCFHWFGSALQKHVLKEPAYGQRVVLRFLSFAEKVFNDFKPTSVLASANCDPMALVFWLLCKEKGIPFLSFRFSKVNSGRGYWSEHLLMDNERSHAVYRCKVADGAAVSTRAKDRVLSFSERPETVDYILDNWRKLAGESVLRVHGDMWSLMRDNLRYFRKGFAGKRPNPVFSKLLEAYRIGFFKHLHAKYYRRLSPDVLRGMRYIYLPLHKEPELMLNYRSPLWHNQRHCIKYISSMLPSDVTLVVREHRGNWGRRHTEWLRYVNGLPGVLLVEPFDSQFNYIENAEIVITDNGSSGWEALLMGRPTITLVDNFYDPVELSHKVGDPIRLDRVIMDVLDNRSPMSRDEGVKRMGLLIDADWETTMDVTEMYANPQVSIEHINAVLSWGKEQ